MKHGDTEAQSRDRQPIARSVWSASGLPALSNDVDPPVPDSAGKPDALHTLRADQRKPRSVRSIAITEQRSHKSRMKAVGAEASKTC